MELKKSLKLASELFTKCKNEEELSFLIEDLLTPSEICELGDRINITRMLKNGNTQREIANKLGVSITTVSRGSRMLSYEKKIIDKLI